MNFWSEVRNDFYNEDEKAIYIDAWKTQNPNEEGRVIAKVYDTGEILYLHERAKSDEEVQEIIKKLF